MADIGEPQPHITTHVDDGIKRLVYALSCAPELKRLLTIFLTKIQEMEDVMDAVRPSTLFRVDTAVGVQLDQLGTILGLSREGWDDATYRIYLRTQSLLILPDRRTQRKLLEVIRSLMNTEAGTILYSEYRAKTYTIQVAGVDLDELITWLRFIERCRPATYIAQIIWNPDGAFGYEDESGTVATTVEGFSDESETIDVGGPYSAVISS